MKSHPMSRPLVDRYGRTHTYLRISVTDRCNLRCTYCMPPEGIDWRPREDILTYEEMVRLARVFSRSGVNKIRLTGGEPTIRHDLEDLMAGLARLEGVKSLLMTTNGVNLAHKAAGYQACGLTGLNISLDTLKPERFEQITRRPYFDQVMQGLDAALGLGFQSVKLNVVVMAGVNDDEILDFVAFVKDKPLNVRFIEFMPFKSNGWQETRMVTYADMKGLVQAHYPLIPILQEPSAVAKDFAIEGFQGTVSFITSMSNSFCGSCNRVRLTADGSIKSCLFFPAEINVREDLRRGATDSELALKVHEAVRLKPEGHAALHQLPEIDNRSMVQIGG